jgi:hypothetical protein
VILRVKWPVTTNKGGYFHPKERDAGLWADINICIPMLAVGNTR